MNSGVGYEFRTTVVPKFHSVDDIKQIAKLIDGANCFVFYEFVLDYAINQDLSMKWSLFDISTENMLCELAEFCKMVMESVILRMANLRFCEVARELFGMYGRCSCSGLFF